MLAAPDDEAGEARARPLLGPADLARAGRGLRPDARRRTVIGRGLLRIVAGRLLGMPPAAVDTGTSPGGAPRAGRLAVSITHTAGLVVAAASADALRVGVDVERLGRRTRPLAIARRHFTAAEAAALEAMSGALRRESFLRLWTLKEAWGKAAGVAVPAALPRIGFPVAGLEAPPPVASVTPHTVVPPSRFPGRGAAAWRFWVIRQGDHTIAVAMAAAGPPAAARSPVLLGWGRRARPDGAGAAAVSDPGPLRT